MLKWPGGNRVRNHTKKPLHLYTCERFSWSKGPCPLPTLPFSTLGWYPVAPRWWPHFPRWNRYFYWVPHPQVRSLMLHSVEKFFWVTWELPFFFRDLDILKVIAQFSKRMLWVMCCAPPPPRPALRPMFTLLSLCLLRTRLLALKAVSGNILSWAQRSLFLLSSQQLLMLTQTTARLWLSDYSFSFCPPFFFLVCLFWLLA